MHLIHCVFQSAAPCFDTLFGAARKGSESCLVIWSPKLEEAQQHSHAAIAFTGRNYARLNPRTSLDVLSLSQRRTQLALRDGSGIFDVGALAPDELFEVATPNGAVDFQQPGLYQVGIDDGGNTLVS